MPDGCTAPFVSSTSNSYSRYTIRSGARTHAIRFTGAEKASFLVSRNSDTRKTVVAVYSYVGTTQTLVESKSMASGSIGELLFDGLTTSTNYIAYIYGSDASNNSDWYEFALKAPVTTFTVTYKAGAGTGDDVVDNNAAAVADCPNTFTAPAGKDFVNWNTESDGSGTSYAVGATVTSNLTLYAQWAATHSVTYSLGDATAGTVPTQASLAEGATFSVAAAPGDLEAPAGKEFKCWNDGTNEYNPGATYTMSTSDVTLTAVYQDRTYQGLTPTSTMDFDNPGSMFASVWTTGNNLTQNFYFDAPNGVAVFSAFALYQAKNNSKIAWMISDNASSTDDTWSATGSFKGNSYYFSSSSKAATVRAAARMHYYRVKGITGASALMGGKAKMEAYLVTEGVVSADPVKDNTIDAAGTLSITGLNAANEYIIKVYGDNGNSNVQFREIAFTFTAVTSVSKTISSTLGWGTYCSPYALDFSSSIANLTKAYLVTGGADGKLTLSPITTTIPASTGILLEGSGEVNIPVAASSSTDVSSNKLVGVTAETSGVAAGIYVLLYGADDASGPVGFYKTVNAFTIGANTAYLPANFTAGGAREAYFFGGVTGIDEAKAEAAAEKEGKFVINGQLVIKKNGKMFNANGAQMK